MKMDHVIYMYNYIRTDTDDNENYGKKYHTLCKTVFKNSNQNRRWRYPLGYCVGKDLTQGVMN